MTPRYCLLGTVRCWVDIRESSSERQACRLARAAPPNPSEPCQNDFFRPFQHLSGAMYHKCMLIRKVK